MLKIRKRRLLASALVATGLVVPAAVFAVGNFAKINDSYADGIDAAAAAVGIPDRNLYGCVVDSYNADNGTSIPKTQQLTTEQLESMENLWCELPGYGEGDDWVADTTYAVQDWTGILKLKNLVAMRLNGQPLTNVNFPGGGAGNKFNKMAYLMIVESGLVDFSANLFPNLEELWIRYNKNLKSLSLVSDSGPVPLKALGAENCALTSINLGDSYKTLEFIDLRYNKLTSFGLTSYTADKPNDSVQFLELWGNPLTQVEVGGLQALEYLGVSDTNISSLDISHNTKLRRLRADGSDSLKSIDISNNRQLANLGLDEDDVVETGVKPTKSGGNYVYDFSGFSFLNPYVKFADSPNYSAPGTTLTVTNYAGTGGYANVRQVVSGDTAVLPSDSFSFYHYFVNNYKDPSPRNLLRVVDNNYKIALSDQVQDDSGSGGDSGSGNNAGGNTNTGGDNSGDGNNTGSNTNTGTDEANNGTNNTNNANNGNNGTNDDNNANNANNANNTNADTKDSTGDGTKDSTKEADGTEEEKTGGAKDNLTGGLKVPDTGANAENNTGSTAALMLLPLLTISGAIAYRLSRKTRVDFE